MAKTPIAFIVLALIAVGAAISGLASAPSTGAAVTFTVNSTGDGSDIDLLDSVCDAGGGACTLRAAIEEANDTAGADIIAFDLPSTPATIVPATCLPVITGTVDVDATTETGYAGTPLIELDGSVSVCAHGLRIDSSGGSVQGLAISDFGSGVVLSPTGSGVTVSANYFGIHTDGSAWLANTRGIEIQSPSNVIGGTTAADRNVIANSDEAGIYITGPDATGNDIIGNYIGTDPTGTVASSTTSSHGIFINDNSHGNTIGGPTAAERNVISGNDDNGIELESDNNVIQGNYIGTDPTGTSAVANDLRGIYIDGGSGNLIGGENAGEGNLISGNGDDGIRGTSANTATIRGNLIGTSVSGLSPLGNGNRGIFMASSDSGQIGGPTAQSRNVISANGTGILIGSTNDDWASLTIEGNYIGVGIDGTTSIPNTVAGATIMGSSFTGDIDTLIGGTTAGAGNVIKDGLNIGTRTDGTVVFGNDITNDGGVGLSLFNAFGVQVGGIDPGEANTITGATAEGVTNDRTIISLGLQNSIRGNAIHTNAGVGIDNINGANVELTPPTINATDPVGGTSCANCTIDIYSDANDEGAVYEGTTVANGAGVWSLAVDLTGPNITATATDADGNTSEFSASVPCLDTDLDTLCNAGDPDDDNDGNPDVSDGCPTTITQWTTPAGDTDCDGFSTADETSITTNPADNCGFTAGGNPSSETWPADLAESNSINITDVLALKPVFGTSVPPTSARFDIAPSGTINISDVLLLKPFFGLSCTP